MKIAQIAPIVERIPPRKYGGTERVVYSLTEQLVKMGHQVTLFASGNSKTSAKLVSVYPISLREAKERKIYGTNTWTELNIANAFGDHHKFDVIHDHTGQDRSGHLGYVIANFISTPTVVTMHNPITRTKKPLFSNLNKPFIVTLSKSQMPKELRKIPNYAGVVHNGLNMENYPFSANSGKFLLFVGRFSRTKGAHFGIAVARKLKLPLIMAAKLDYAFLDDIRYFKEEIEPFLSDKIQWIGEVTESKRNDLMSQALCLLHPGVWREPFGLNLIEAMACGTPVVGFNHGSIPEIIKDSKVGFVVKTIDEMVIAVNKVASLDRNKIREYSLKNFNSLVMAKKYLKIYKSIIKTKDK